MGGGKREGKTHLQVRVLERQLQQVSQDGDRLRARLMWGTSAEGVSDSATRRGKAGGEQLRLTGRKGSREPHFEATVMKYPKPSTATAAASCSSCLEREKPKRVVIA